MRVPLLQVSALYLPQCGLRMCMGTSTVPLSSLHFYWTNLPHNSNLKTSHHKIYAQHIITLYHLLDRKIYYCWILLLEEHIFIESLCKKNKRKKRKKKESEDTLQKVKFKPTIVGHKSKSCQALKFVPRLLNIITIFLSLLN